MVKNLNMEKNNKLIAKFMGWERDDFSLDGYIIPKNWNSHHDLCQDFDSLSPKDMMFHNSWDWLMPVVDKIEDTCSTNLHKYSANQMIKEKYTFEILSYSNNFGNTTYGKNKLQVIYKGVVEFIKWYNKIKK